MKIIISISVLFASVLTQSTNLNAQTQGQCADLATHPLPAPGLEITLAEWRENYTPPPRPFGPPVTQTFPPHCHIEGLLDRRTGYESKPYAIAFALNLPDNWNGRFLFQGGGGLNGNVSPPFGLQSAGDNPALARGYAVVSTDSGHQSKAVFDAAFFADQEASLNFFYKAVGKVTVTARQIIAGYYAPQRPDRTHSHPGG